MQRYCALFVIVLLLVSAGFVMAQEGTNSNIDDRGEVIPSWVPNLGQPVQSRFSELDEVSIAFVRDAVNGWGNIATILDTMAELTYDVITSADLATADLSEYVAIVVDGNQSGTFYTNINANMDVLEEFVDDGGWLEFHGANNSHNPYWELWDGTTYIYSLNSTTNYIQDDEHPIVEGEANPEGNSCNHGYLTDYPDDANIIVSQDEAGVNATLIEYAYGSGNVVVTTMTYAHMWNNNYAGAYLAGNTLTYVVYHPIWGALMGTVTDTGDDPIDGAEINVYDENDEFVATTTSDENGDYEIIETLFEGTYYVTAFAPGYVLATETDVAIVSEDTTTVDFSLAANEETVTISGTVISADTPDTPIAGITVYIPLLDVSDVTDENGDFDLGTQFTGTYTFVISNDPEGSEVYHTMSFAGVEVDDDAVPLSFSVYEILPPQNLAGASENGSVTLSWDPPANMEQDEMMAAALEQEIGWLAETIELIEARGTQQERAKLPLIEQEMYQKQSILNSIERRREQMENGEELDEITDFLGYRIKMTYPNGLESLLDDYVTATTHTVGNLQNGNLYNFMVAADYGYGEDYLVWSNEINIRPLPTTGYVVSVVDYDWIEINPANGGDGEVAINAGDDSNSGEISFAPLSFEYWGNDYDSFGACTNGWFSFTNFTSGSITVDLPNTALPNAVLQALNGDFHAGVADDDMAIWYLVDDEEDLVVVQYLLRPLGNTEYRYSYQIVLDCANGSIQFNYEEADDWPYYHRGPTGIENVDGTEAYIWDYTLIEDEYSIFFQAPDWDWGSISGMVYDDVTLDPLEGVTVVATDSEDMTWTSETDENGWFTVLVNAEDGPWDLSLNIPGWYESTVTNVTIPVDSFGVQIDDVYMEGVPIGYYDDFEDDQGPWETSLNNIPDDWDWGTPTSGPDEAHSGVNLWAQNLSGNHHGAPSYGATRGDTLWSTQEWYVGSEDAVLTYWHWHDYYISGTTFYNGYNVQISTDGGMNWDIITPIGNYDGSCNYMGETGYPLAEAIFGGTTDGWEQVAFELGDYFGEDIMLMFHAAGYYYTGYQRAGVYIDDVRLHGVPVPSRIEGYVTDSGDESVIAGADVNLWYDGEVVGHGVTDENGFYSINEVVPSLYRQNDYELEAFAAFYMADTLHAYDVTEGDTLVADFELDEETRTSNIFGSVFSEDTPDTPVEGALVTIPQLGLTETTDADGEFDFGAQIIGIYTLVVHFDTPQTFHETHFYNQQITVDNESIDLLIPEIMPPATFSADDSDMAIVLTWTDPANTPEEDLMQLRVDIEAFRASINELRSTGDPRALAKLPEEEQRLFSMENRLARLEQLAELEIDDIEDFQGYRIYLDGEILDTLLYPWIHTYTINGLSNGHEYHVSVAADYGYDEDYLVWATDEEGEITGIRPLPPAGYVFNPMEYEWIELDPDEGGDGEVAHDNGDDANSGEVSFAPLEFDFYGTTYSSFGACTNGWMSFTDFTSGTIGPALPSTSAPNATVIALNGDYHAGVSGDDCNIWYLVDEANDRVVIQFRLRPYGGSHTDYRHNYQVVLDCETNAMHFNYNTSEDWMEYVRQNGVVGVENETGMAASTFNMESIVDEMSLSVRYVEAFGNVIGTITDANEDPIAGAYVFLQEDRSAYGISDENGFYEILLANTENAPYTVVCEADGYVRETVQDVDWENGEFDQEVDFQLDVISDQTPPYFVSWDVDYDDRLSFVLGEPGAYQHMMTMQYDDGTAADAWVIPANGENAMWAVPFEASTEARIVQAEIRVTIPNSAWGNWPDAQSDPVIVKIFADDNGQPGEVLYTSPATVAQHGSVVINPSLEIEGRFWVGFYAQSGLEALCVDTYANNGDLVSMTLDGENWQQFEVNGDPMIRIDLHSASSIEMVDIDDLNLPEATFDKGAAVPVAATHQSPVYGVLAPMYSPKASLREGWNRDLRSELDEFLGFNIYYSTDGEDFELANEDLIEDTEYDLILGSDMENVPIWVYATAWVESDGEEFNSDPSDTLLLAFNMPPDAPADVVVEGVNHIFRTATVSWDAPTTNADGTPLVDLEGYRVDANYELYDSTDVAGIDVQMLESGYYTFDVYAFDEVPNQSNAGSSPSTRIGDPPFWSSFEDDNDDPNPFEGDGTVWAHGEPTAGPGEAYEGDMVWATYLDGNYNNNEDAFLTCTHGWEPIDQVVLLGYYHWTNFETGWDGYNLQVSTDNGASWEVVTPIGGYNDTSVNGLDNEAGFTGSSNEWQYIQYDLSEYADADSIHIRFRYGSDSSGNSYYGVAIDNMEIWGVPSEARCSIEGYVWDAADDPMNGVMVYLEEFPQYYTYTGEDGYYFLFNVPADTMETSTIIAEYPYYWPSMADTILVPDDTMTVDFTQGTGRALLYPDGNISNSSVELLVDLNAEVGDSTGSVDIDLESDGTGPLQWYSYVWVVDNATTSGDVKFDGKATTAGPEKARNGRMMRKTSDAQQSGPTLKLNDDDMGPVVPNELDERWDWLMTLDVGSATMNAGCVGPLVTSEGIFVTAVYLNEEYGDNYFYQFDLNGNPIAAREYPADIIGEGGTIGPVDVAWDPVDQWVYGANENGDVWKFKTDMSEYEWVHNLGFWPTGLAYDFNENYLYAIQGNVGMAVVDLSNGAQGAFALDEEVGPSLGIAYNPLDLDDMTIYVLSQNGDGEGGYLHRFDPVNLVWDTYYQTIYEADAGSSGGIEISLGYHNARYDMVTLLQSETDIVDIWEGQVAPLDWLWITPDEGSIEPQEMETVTVHADISSKAEFQDVEVGDEIAAELVFSGPYWANPPVIDLAVIFIDGLAEDAAEMPTKYALHQNYPNPFNPQTQIKFDLVNPQKVRLTVYNVMGQEVMRLVDQPLQAGFHSVTFDATNLASGMYFYRIEAGNFTSMKKMVMVK